MLFLPKFDLDQVLAALPKATAMMGVPTFYTRLLASDRFTRDVAAHMRLFISGSAPLSAEVHKEFRERTGHAILERYGMTETNMNTSNPYDGARRPGTVGFPLPGVGLASSMPEPGESCRTERSASSRSRGPTFFLDTGECRKRRRRNFGQTAISSPATWGASMKTDMFPSSQVQGSDHQRWFQRYPAEVEALLDELPGVAESAVIGVPHPDFGEAVVAVLAPKPGAELGQDAVQASLNDRLAKFKQPKKVHILEALPRNTMGKIQKNVLRERFSGDFC